MATELGVVGEVRNLPDGTVEALAQADDDQLNAFLAKLHEGPPLARVTRVDTSMKEAGKFEHFTITH